jgi:hypothetical protein
MSALSFARKSGDLGFEQVLGLRIGSNARLKKRTLQARYFAAPQSR